MAKQCKNLNLKKNIKRKKKQLMTRTVTAFLRKLEFKIEDKDLRIACYPLLSLRFHYACATMMSEGAEAATSNTGSSPSI